MEDFLRQLRKQIDEFDLDKVLKDIDLSRLESDQLKSVDLGTSARKIRRQLQQLDRERREEDAASEGFLGGVVLGVIVGAVLALIFAPRSGSETRELVAGTATDLMHRAESMVSHGQEESTTDEPETTSLPTEPAIERDFGSDARPNSTAI